MSQREWQFLLEINHIGARFSNNGAGLSSDRYKAKNSQLTPMIIKKITATTLMPENQYSASAKPLVVKAFSPNNSRIKAAHQIQTDTSGNHRLHQDTSGSKLHPRSSGRPDKIHPA